MSAMKINSQQAEMKNFSQINSAALGEFEEEKKQGGDQPGLQ